MKHCPIMLLVIDPALLYLGLMRFHKKAVSQLG